MFTYTKFKQAHISDILSFSDPYPIAKLTNRFSSITPAAQSGDRWHAWIIPAIYIFLIHQLQKFSFAHHSIRNITAGKLILFRRKNFQLPDQPIVQLTMRYKLKRTDRVCHLLY